MTASRGDATQKTEWSKLRVGQTAYLGSFLIDEDDIMKRPICLTYGALEGSGHPSGTNCRPSRRVGTLVIITAIGPPLHDAPTAGIRAANGAWTGWVESRTLVPIIPVGTRIVFTKIGSGDVAIYHSRANAAQMKEKDIDIGSPATGVVLHQDAPSGACDLQIRVVTGPKAGMTGWTCNSGNIEGTNIEATTLN